MGTEKRIYLKGHSSVAKKLKHNRNQSPIRAVFISQTTSLIEFSQQMVWLKTFKPFNHSHIYSYNLGIKFFKIR